MSAGTAEREATRIEVDLGTVGIVAYLLFWGWLVARWVNDWILPAGVGVPRGEPFLPSALFAGVSQSLVITVETLPALAAATWYTILLTVASIVLGFFIAVPLSVVRVYGNYSGYVALAYTELIRGTPLLAQLFVLYYGTNLTVVIRELPAVGVGPIPNQAFWVAIIGFTINSSAYQSEYIRSALQSVDPGQLTAARAVGLSKLEGIRFVVLPQALRFAIPGWSNELVYLIKYSSLASFITVRELFNVAQTTASQNFQYLVIFTLVALLYLGIVITASNVVGRFERRVSIPGLGSRRGE